MQNSKSYYDILGVETSATSDKIKKAYRELSLKHQPDRGGDSGKFQQLNIMELKDIKAGDYLYYTELPYSNYADSLIEIREVNGALMAHPICTHFYRSGYINQTDKNWGDDMAVSEYYDPTSWHPTTYTEGDPAEWMNKNYPLDDSKY